MIEHLHDPVIQLDSLENATKRLIGCYLIVICPTMLSLSLYDYLLAIRMYSILLRYYLMIFCHHDAIRVDVGV